MAGNRTSAGRRALVAAAVLAGTIAGFGALPTKPAAAVVGLPGTPGKQFDSWAFCGVRPSDPTARATAKTMATLAGIDVTMGPCNVPNSSYTPVNPANRYVDAATYRQLVDINAEAGMRTAVYDPRVWSTVKADRDAAYTFWLPVLDHVAVWDLGDEFQPGNTVQWNTLKTRWNQVRADIMVRTGIAPFVNHIPEAVEKALTDLPGSDQLISFDRYTDDLGASFARAVDSRVKTVMCAVNTYQHLIFEPTPDSVREAMSSLAAAGCDRFLIFGGAKVYDTTLFGASSLADAKGGPTSLAAAVLEGGGRSSYTPVGPARLFDSRIAAPTVDGLGSSGGTRLNGQTTTLQVVGRANVPDGAAAVALNITTTNATAGGFVTVYPCDGLRPNAAQVNFTARTDQATAVFAKLSATGSTCLFTSNPTDLVVDVVGAYPLGASFTPVDPARVLETRTDPGLATVDGLANGGGPLAPGAVTELQVGGRGGVPADATDVELNITALNAKGPGYVTVFPCGPRPVASHVNYVVGAVATNAVQAALDARGKICIFSLLAVDLVVDVNGYDTITPFTSVVPARLLDSRPVPNGSSIDGLQVGLGVLAAGSVTPVRVAGRGGVDGTARGAVLNVTATDTVGNGFLTVYPCGLPRPVASNLNLVTRATVTNLAVSKIGDAGDVCIFVSAATNVIVDVNDFHP